MSVDRFSLDANVFFYSIDTTEESRHLRAMEVVERAALEHDCLVTLADPFRASRPRPKQSEADKGT